MNQDEYVDQNGHMEPDGYFDKGKKVARPPSWREQDDLGHMQETGQNVATAGPAVAGSQAPGPLPAVQVQSGEVIDQNAKPQTPPALNEPVSGFSFGPDVPGQPAPVQHTSVQSAQHAAPPNGRSGSNTSGSGQCNIGSGSLPARVNRPQPNYTIEETIPVTYLVFLTRSSSEVNEPEFHQLEVKAPVTSRAYRGAPPVSFRAKKKTVRKDQHQFIQYLGAYNKEIFAQKERICVKCGFPTETFYSQFKALYKFHKLESITDPQREGVYRPMCQIIPVCAGPCLTRLTAEDRIEELQNSFLDTFGKFPEFQYNNPERDFVIFEYPKKRWDPVLTWCGVCRDRWYAPNEASSAPLSRQFRNHCSKPDKCQKLSRERAHGRAGSDAGSGAAAQNLDTTSSPADQQSNSIASPSNVHNDENTSRQSRKIGCQQQLSLPNRQENNLQDQPAVDPPVRPDSNRSDSTLQGRAKCLGRSDPWGEVKGAQFSEQDGESRRGGFVNTLKGTFGRRAGRDLNNQNDADQDRPGETFWQRIMCRSVNTS